MSEWKKVKLGELCSKICSGGTPDSKNRSFYGGDIPWLNTKEVDFGRIYRTENTITEEGLNNSAAKWVEANSIVIAMYGNTAGKSAITKIPLTTNQACCNLTIDKDKADYNYVFYCVLKSYEELASMANGAAQKNLNAQMVKGFEIPLPPLATQHRIATILSRYDSLIENYQKQIKLLEEAAQRLYKEWFIDLHFPGYQNTNIIDGVPEGWEKKKVSDVVVFYDKMRKPLSSMQRQSMEKIYPYYGAASLMDYVDNYIFDGTYLLMGEDGTVVSNEKYPMLQYVCGKFWVSNHAHVLQGREPYSTEFIYMMFRQMTILDIVTGAAQPKISQGRLAAKEIIMPTNELVKDYEKIVVPMIQQTQSLQSQLRLLTEARDRLLPKLMSGDIEVKKR